MVDVVEDGVVVDVVVGAVVLVVVGAAVVDVVVEGAVVDGVDDVGPPPVTVTVVNGAAATGFVGPDAGAAAGP